MTGKRQLYKKDAFLCKNYENLARKKLQMIPIQYQPKIVVWRVQTNAIVFFAQIQILELKFLN